MAPAGNDLCRPHARRGMGPLSHMRLYLANESGISNCLGAATGKKPCLVARGSGANASPLQAGGSVYASSETGTMIVFTAADRLLLVAHNEIKKQCPTSPVACSGRLYRCTAGSLNCIGQGE